jgi:hypothetical protein
VEVEAQVEIIIQESLYLQNKDLANSVVQFSEKCEKEFRSLPNFILEEIFGEETGVF